MGARRAMAPALRTRGGIRARPPGQRRVCATIARRRPPPRRSPATSRPRPLNPKYTFEQFVIGTSNRLAHAAALAVAETPTQAYNPLFIYGPPGLGKTHLLHAIANYIRSFGAGMTVRYVTGEDFTNAFLASLHTRGTDASKRTSAMSTCC